MQSLDLSHPTSLLCRKVEGGYKLVGVMVSAPARVGEDELNRRFPTSIAPWHEHVNFCAAPKGQEQSYFGSNARFGLLGSIITESECATAGGKFYPNLFGWMVHLCPFES